MRRAGLAALVAVGVAVAAVAADAAVLLRRSPTVTVTTPGSGEGTAYLLLASDSRERLDDGDRRRYADRMQATGERADLVMVLRRPEGGEPELVSLPRDLYVGSRANGRHRLGLALSRGPQAVVTALCGDLGIGVDHVAVLDFRGLIDLVDTVGGVDVSTTAPTRDDRAGLHLDRPGPHHLDGQQALAWVRSRHPQVLVDGRWASPAHWDPTRTSHAVEVLGQVTERLDGPLAAHRVAWSAAPRVRRDTGLGVREAASLALDLRAALQSGRVRTVPARMTTTQVPLAFVTPETEEALRPLRSASCTSSG